MSGLGLEACAGFGTAAIRVSEEAKSGGGTVWQAEASQASCSTESKGLGMGLSPSSPSNCLYHPGQTPPVLGSSLLYTEGLC